MSTEYTKIKTEGVLLNRFWGGVDRGVCLQITKPNTWKDEYNQYTLEQAKELQKDLVLVVGHNTHYKIANNFYIPSLQCIHLRQDLNLFINDSIHKEA